MTNIITGARVAYNQKGKVFFGIVESDSDSRAKVMFDAGKVYEIPKSRLASVLFWHQYKRPVDEKELAVKFYKGDDWLKVFKSKTPVDYDSILPRCMWLWANKNVFNNRLSMPKIVVGNSRALQKAAGRYSYSRTGPAADTINISKTMMPTYFSLFSVMLHEMIHQYNFRIDWQTDKSWTPTNLNIHGEEFTKWIKPILGKTGVKISRLHHTEKIDIDVDEEAKPVDDAKAEMVILIQYPTANYAAVIKTKSEGRQVVRDLIALNPVSKFSTHSVSEKAILNFINQASKKSNRSHRVRNVSVTNVNEKIRDEILKYPSVSLLD